MGPGSWLHMYEKWAQYRSCIHSVALRMRIMIRVLDFWISSSRRTRHKFTDKEDFSVLLRSVLTTSKHTVLCYYQQGYLSVCYRVRWISRIKEDKSTFVILCVEAAQTCQPVNQQSSPEPPTQCRPSCVSITVLILWDVGCPCGKSCVRSGI